MLPRRRTTSILTALTLAAGLAVAAPVTDAHATPTTTTITVDGSSPGRTYDGVSTQSASTSRLLIDYPEPERSQILDYLFKPDYGASLQTLEVEIGSDVNSTIISEPSHERSPGQLDCSRGFEWWLMAQAKARNPHIKLWALAWGFPGWVGKLWSAEQVRYTTDWLTCAKQHGLTIDYLGGSNQRGGTIPPSFFTSLRASARTVFPNLQIAASDQGGTPPYWGFASQVRASTELQQSVDVIGETTVCGWRSQYRHCDGPADPTWNDAIATGKPLWDSSISTGNTDASGELVARSLNRSYIDARVTGHNYWTGLSSVYGNTWNAAIGALVAQWPWSGHYEVSTGVWAMAHTTQFTEPGWRYLDDASGYTPGGASYVSLRSPDMGDYSVVMETMDSSAPETVQVQTTGGLSDKPLQLWSTDVAHPSDATSFRHDGQLRPRDGAVTVTLQPGHVYTLSTLRTAHKGTAHPRATAAQRQPLPYHDDFDSTPLGTLPHAFTDINGGFEAAPCAGRRHGTCDRQVINQPPLIWQRGGNMDPTTVVGDPLWGGDYAVSTDALLEGPGTVSLLGRIERVNKDAVIAYFLSVSDTGAWSLYYQDQGGTWSGNWDGPANSAVNHVLASGTVAMSAATWHNLKLDFRGSRIAAAIDGHALATVHDTHDTSGQVGLRVSRWQNAQFDNLRVVPTAAQPQAITTRGNTATASSSQPGPLQYARFDPQLAVDGNPQSEWMSAFCADPAHSDWQTPCAQPGVARLPQWIAVDLHRRRGDVAGLVYDPPVGNTRVAPDGIVTGYRISVSRDGRTYEPVASGTWGLDISAKTATWRPVPGTRFVRFEATAADGGVAGASELRVLRR